MFNKIEKPLVYIITLFIIYQFYRLFEELVRLIAVNADKLNSIYEILARSRWFR